MMNYYYSFQKLKTYCESQEFKGWDPYDGLNSRFFRNMPFSKLELPRLAWIQFFKRSHINFRPLFGVDKDYNPKGIGLFLNGYCNLYKLAPNENYLQKIIELADLLIKIKNEGYSGVCWGYNFDWQARAFFQPKGTPTVVATTFIASALLEAYRITKRLEYLNTAIDTQYFILKDLNRTYDKDGDFSFSYSPLDKTQVFNASLLGSRLLSQIYGHTKDENLLTEARKSVSFAAKHQQKNGEWAYGTLPFHQWIDSFHTGYNLECIHAYQQYSGDKSFNQVIESGTNYYLKNFFTSKGIPKYYNNRIYPIDVHATSQLIITLSRLKIWDENIDLTKSVLMWTIINMQDPKGYFYYQLKKNFNSKIPYMRWAQAWMFYAFTEFLLNENTSELATNSKVTFQVKRN